MQQILNLRGLKIYQDTNLQSFTLDSILLEDFININRKSKNILEVGTGNAVISMLLSKRTSAKIDAVEILKESVDIANKNILENDIKNVEIINEDIKKFKKDENQIYDIVFSNPPYFKLNENENQMKNSEYKKTARNEKELSIDEIIKISNRLLKNNGHLYLVFRVDRMIEIIKYVNLNKMSVKHIKFVYTKKDKEALICLMDIVKIRTSEVHVLEPIVVYDENGDKSKYIKELYSEKRRNS